MKRIFKQVISIFKTPYKYRINLLQNININKTNCKMLVTSNIYKNSCTFIISLVINIQFYIMVSYPSILTPFFYFMFRIFFPFYNFLYGL